MPMRPTLLMSWIAVALAAVALPALGGEDKGEPGDLEQRMGYHRAMRVEHAIEVLDLSAQQVEEWREAHEARWASRTGGFEDGHDLYERIQELAAAEDPDPTAIGELVIEAHRRREAARAEHDAFQSELMAILTPEQQERFQAMQRRDRDGGFRMRPGPGPHHHRP